VATFRERDRHPATPSPRRCRGAMAFGMGDALILAVVTTALTPVASEAGGWLHSLRRNYSLNLGEHARPGGWIRSLSRSALVTIGYRQQ
jgi:hypothetical protein